MDRCVPLAPSRDLETCRAERRPVRDGMDSRTEVGEAGRHGLVRPDLQGRIRSGCRPHEVGVDVIRMLVRDEDGVRAVGSGPVRERARIDDKRSPAIGQPNAGVAHARELHHCAPVWRGWGRRSAVLPHHGPRPRIRPLDMSILPLGIDTARSGVDSPASGPCQGIDTAAGLPAVTHRRPREQRTPNGRSAWPSASQPKSRTNSPSSTSSASPSRSRRPARPTRACARSTARRRRRSWSRPAAKPGTASAAGSVATSSRFVMQRDGVDFPEALQALAAKAGVEIDEHTRREDAHRARLRDVARSGDRVLPHGA